MRREIDTDVILTELQALAQDSTGAATVAVLACMDVVERHAKIVDEAEIKSRLVDVTPLIVQRGLAWQPGELDDLRRGPVGQ